MKELKVACIQVNTGNGLETNIETAIELVRIAGKRGAKLVLMPENVVMMKCRRSNILASAISSDEHVALTVFRTLARELHVWLHCGTLAVSKNNGLVANRTYILRPDGGIAAVYDKIHLFDADLGDEGGVYKESSIFVSGDRAVVVDTPWGGLGLSVCYDLRFPQLYRSLARVGASFLAIPAAFTYLTGAAHWCVLLRARAIENGCYVFAPAQTGGHANNCRSYGHTMIINPWGEVLADANEAPGLIVADIDPSQVKLARQKIPSLYHDRPFALP